MKHPVRFREILGDSTLTLPPEVREPRPAERAPSMEYHFSVARDGQRQPYRLAVWSSV